MGRLEKCSSQLHLRAEGGLPLPLLLHAQRSNRWRCEPNRNCPDRWVRAVCVEAASGGLEADQIRFPSHPLCSSFSVSLPLIPFALLPLIFFYPISLPSDLLRSPAFLPSALPLRPHQVPAAGGCPRQLGALPHLHHFPGLQGGGAQGLLPWQRSQRAQDWWACGHVVRAWVLSPPFSVCCKRVRGLPFACRPRDRLQVHGV